MNITLHNNTYNKYNQNFNNCRPKPQSFTANASAVTIDAAEKLIEQTGKGGSSFFKPVSDFYNKCSLNIAKYITSKVADSKVLNYTADKLKNNNNLFQHCLTLGSLITSGLYMQRTLTNDKMDKDRKKTLAVNQFLTFLLSTIGAYSLDKYLKSWWENVTSKYVGLQINDLNFNKNFKDIKTAINKVNKALKKNPNADIFKLGENAKEGLNMSDIGKKYFEHALKKAVENSDSQVKSVSGLSLNKYIGKLVKDEHIPKLSKKLGDRIAGMGLLRSMLVFGFVYRFFVPVVVTKPANWLCDKYLEHKKSKNNVNNAA